MLLIPLLIAGGAYLYFSSRDRTWTMPALSRTVPAPSATPAAAPLPTEAPVEPREKLPPLDESDTLIRKLAAALSSHPGWASWLITEGLVRRFVVIVDNVAEGVAPRKHVPFLAPKGSFQTAERRGSRVIDPRSYTRYDLTADIVASLDTRGCAELYKRLKPLIQDAYRDLGYPDRNFDVTLARAIDRLDKTPVPEGQVTVREGVKSFKYENPELEALTPAQKQFLRMGPANMKKVKQKLRDLSESLGLPRKG